MNTMIRVTRTADGWIREIRYLGIWYRCGGAYRSRAAARLGMLLLIQGD